MAVKIMNKRKLLADPQTRESVQHEIDALRRLRHPNVVAFRELFEGDKYLYLVLELASGGDLFDKVAGSDGVLLILFSYFSFFFI